MSDETKLPPGWAWTSLVAVAELKGGITKGQRRRQGEVLRIVPYLRVANVQRGYIDLTEMKEIEASDAEVEELRLAVGDVLFNEGGDRDKLGRGWIWNGELPLCIHQNHVFRARIRANTIHPKLLSWWGNTFGQQYFQEQGKQTTNLASINITKLGALPIPVPPLSEQSRIVSAIDQYLSDIDAGVAALQRALANLKRYRASVLKAACEGRLVPTEAELASKEGRAYEPADVLLRRILVERRARWEADQLAKMKAKGQVPRDDRWKDKYEEPKVPDTSRLTELPAGWCWVHLGQVSDIQGGIQKQPKRAPRENKYPFLRVANVGRGRLDLVEVHEIELFGDELNRLRLERGDLLIVEGNGSPTEIGRLALWDGSIENCVHQNHIIRARLRDGCLPAYMSTAWNSPDGTTRTMNVASSTSGLYTLSVSKVELLPIPLPPLAEQHRIVAEVDRLLSVADETEQLLRAQLTRAERLRQAVLKRAFEGKLVPQDPTDEPATALLERLRQPQTAPEPPKKTARRRPAAIP